jgi:glycosyltransferase involved in cell wall biosynthesis
MKKVAVVVHNNVFKDARVLKEVSSLHDSGHMVHVFGMSERQESTKIPGIKVELNLVSFRKVLTNFNVIFILLPKLLARAVIVFLGSLILFYVFKAFNISEILMAIVTTTILMLLHVLKILISRSKRKKSQISKSAPEKSEYNRFSYFSYLKKRILYHIYARSLAKKIASKKINFDLIHCHDIIGLEAGLILKRRNKNTRLVWDAHEMYDELANKDENLSSLHRKIINSAQRKVDGFITISESFSEIYKKKYPHLPNAKIVMNACNYQELGEYDDRLHRACGFKKDRKILLFQGGLSQHRGVELLLDASDYLDPSWGVVFMGWGKLEEKVRQKIKLNPKMIKLIPPAPHEELQQWTQGASLGAIPYVNNSMNHLYCTPNKLWEFPAAGVPALVSPMVEMKKIVSEHGYGVVLDEKFSGESIANLVNSLTQERLDEMRSCCLKFIQNFNWSHYEKPLLELYK